MTNEHIKEIIVLMAMEAEAKGLIDALKLKHHTNSFSPLPFQLFQGLVGQTSIKLVVSGKDHRYDVDNIGTQAAAVMAQTSLQRFSPDLIISAGTAGGFAKHGADIGTVYLSDEQFIFHDRRVPMSGFDESGVGHYPAYNVRQMAKDLSLPIGVVSSGSSLEKSERDVKAIEQNNAVAKEMEAASIAWICWLHQQPFFTVKSITNLLDGDGASEDLFQKNLSYASDCLIEQLLKVLRYCSDHSLAELSG